MKIVGYFEADFNPFISLELPKRIVLTAIAVFLYGIVMIPVSGQVASFTVADGSCVNTPVNILNTSTGATTYSWTFCTSDVNGIPQATNLGNPDNNAWPRQMDYGMQNGNYYAFVINGVLNSPAGLTRLDFGNSLLNTPVAVPLGNPGGVIPDIVLGGIQLVQDRGKWYAIIVAGNQQSTSLASSAILKIEFGADLTNPAPVVTNWGNIGGLGFPQELYLFRDVSSNWHGFTLNYHSSTITRFSFDADFNNPPSGVNLGNQGNLNGPVGMSVINDNGTWRVFIVNSNPGGSISRIDFGNSLLNTPVNAVNLGNPGNHLSDPRDLHVFSYCGSTVGYVMNRNTVVKLDFNSLGAAPTGTLIRNVTSADVHSMSRLFFEGGQAFAFVISVSPRNLIRIQFPGCTATSISSSSQASPPPVVYNTPGIYNINLTIDAGLPTQSSFCKQVVVGTTLPITKSADATICRGDSVQLSVSGGANYQWTPSAGLSNSTVSHPKASPAQTTKYYIDASNNGCVTRDSITVSVIQVPIFDLTPANISICPGDTVQIVASGGDSYRWLAGNNPVTNGIIVTPTVTTQYPVEIRSQTCSAIDTMYATVTVKPAPAVTVFKSADIDCRTNEVQLFALGGIQYEWTPAAGLSSSTISNPFAKVTQNTTYTVAATGLNGCVDTASITVIVQGPGSATNGYYVPNAFTPNHDGLNDCFGIPQWGVITQLQFYVYDRSGQAVFSTKDPSACWDGRFKGIAQPPGTYIYSIKATTNCGEVERTGTVVLVR